MHQFYDAVVRADLVTEIDRPLTVCPRKQVLHNMYTTIYCNCSTSETTDSKLNDEYSVLSSAQLLQQQSQSRVVVLH